VTTGDAGNEKASSATSTSSRFYRPELDGLRFFAFFAVFACHTLSPDPAYYSAHHIPGAVVWAAAAQAGAFGVDLFFLLSAYLITELLLREKDQFGQVHLGAFYLRRILRIWPLYFFFILIAAFLPLVDPTQHFPVRNIVAFMFLFGNLLVSFAGMPVSVVNPLWSVSLEEQFYLFWPVVIARAKRERRLLLIAAAMLVTAELGRWLLVRYGPHTESLLWSNTVARLDPFALGIATAVLARKRLLRFAWLSRLGLATAGGIAWLTAGHYYATNMRFGLFGYPAMALGAWLIFLSLLGVNGTPHWIRYLGKISYGLYAYHELALYLVLKVHGDFMRSLHDFVSYRCASFLLTVGMAALSYRFLESPFLRMKERFAFVKSRPV
jgi:peptidoglycan/LPS O-acetylase OafA/YrhL